jgi:Lon protease-like protein
MSQTITVPIFPLDGVLLVPGSSLRLYIFEQRYQEMLTWALEHDGRIGMAIPAIGHSTSNEHQPPIHKIAGLGEITEHQPHPNGHSEIELRGISRIEITHELPQAWDFRVVQAQILTEDSLSRPVIAREMPPVLQFLQDTDPELFGRVQNAPAQRLIDLALIHLPVDMAVKVQLYSERSLAKRLRMVCEILQQAQPPRPDIDIEPDDPRCN